MAKPTVHTPKLSDTQLVLLNIAAQRDDGALLPLPTTLKAKGAALAKVVATLSRHGLIEERPVAADAPHCRRDSDGYPVGLFLTQAGHKALESHGTAAPRTKATKTKEPPAEAAKRRATSVKSSTKKRRDSRQYVVVRMLRRQGGVSLAEIITKTGWQTHSVRGFLSAVVRKKLGRPVVSDKGEDGVRRYHIAAVTGRGA